MIDRSRRIAVHLTHVGTISNDLFQGLLDFARQQRQVWQIRSEESGQFKRSLSTQPTAGAITAVWEDDAEQDWLDLIARSGCPVVNLLTDMSGQIPSVVSDEAAFGRKGAEYLLGRGLAHFAFFGIGTHWSLEREKGFAQTLRVAGHECFRPPAGGMPRIASPNTPRRLATMQQWLAQLPRPLGVLACNDGAAMVLLSSCEAIGLRVPEDVQILGVDNNEITCELAPVPLSSIVQDFRRLGFMAAKVLDGLMRWEAKPSRTVLVPPGEVITRRSTDQFAFDNENVSACLRLIHQYAGGGMSVKEILEQVPVSRTWLDREFKRVIGHTPSDEIQRIRLDRVQNLLLQTGLPLHVIATRCGFSQVQNLSRFFHDRYGMSPRQFRTKYS